MSWWCQAATRFTSSYLHTVPHALSLMHSKQRWGMPCCQKPQADWLCGGMPGRWARLRRRHGRAQWQVCMQTSAMPPQQQCCPRTATTMAPSAMTPARPAPAVASLSFTACDICSDFAYTPCTDIPQQGMRACEAYRVASPLGGLSLS